MNNGMARRTCRGERPICVACWMSPAITNSEVRPISASRNTRNSSQKIMRLRIEPYMLFLELNTLNNGDAGSPSISCRVCRASLRAKTHRVRWCVFARRLARHTLQSRSLLRHFRGAALEAFGHQLRGLGHNRDRLGPIAQFAVLARHLDLEQ